MARSPDRAIRLEPLGWHGRETVPQRGAFGNAALTPGPSPKGRGEILRYPHKSFARRRTLRLVKWGDGSSRSSSKASSPSVSVTHCSKHVSSFSGRKRVRWAKRMAEHNYFLRI